MSPSAHRQTPGAAMREPGLKHFVRKECQRGGQTNWTLETKDTGEEIRPYTNFCDALGNLSTNTRRAYAFAVSRFLDYLAEAGVLRKDVSRFELLRAIDAYLGFLLQGSEEFLNRHERHGAAATADEWLAEVARGLMWGPLEPASAKVARAAVNRFLRLSELYSRMEAEYDDFVQNRHTDAPLVHMVDGRERVSTYEVGKTKSNSVLGNVVRYYNRGVSRANGLQMPRVLMKDEFDREFPFSEFGKVVAHAQNWRDRLLWLLLAATGVRVSEALNMLLEHIDFEGQEFFIHEPKGPRFIPHREDIRFKGRATARTFPIPQLKGALFHALREYLAREYLPVQEGSPQFLFQYVDGTNRGRPLLEANHGALSKQFASAQKAAGVEPPEGREHWGLHSLRHAYGVYMKNYLPVNPEKGEYGLSLTEVQSLMGHKKLEHTARYARTKFDRLQGKFEQADDAMLKRAIGEIPPELLKFRGIEHRRKPN
jgi:integrase